MHNVTDLAPAAPIEAALATMASHVQMVPLHQLRVDRDHYQRDDRAKQMLEIAQRFHLPSFGIIEVSLREDGYYYILDGQVRVGVLALLGVRHALCLVSNTPAIEDEAQAFLGLNVYRTRVVKADTFQANVTSRSELHLGIQEVLARHGLAVRRQPDEVGRRIRCVGALEEIADTSIDLLDRVLELALEGYDTLTGGLTGMHLRGLHRFLLMHKEHGFDRAHLLRRMGAASPQEFYKKAKFIQESYHGSLELNIARALTVEYNRNLVNKQQRLATPWLTGQDVPAQP
jgi:hypothetical protein